MNRGPGAGAAVPGPAAPGHISDARRKTQDKITQAAAAAPGLDQTWPRCKTQDHPRTTQPGTRTRYSRLQTQGARHLPRQIKIDRAACPSKLRRRRCRQPQNTAYSTQSVTDVWRQCLLLYILIPPKRPFYRCKGGHLGYPIPLCFQL